MNNFMRVMIVLNALFAVTNLSIFITGNGSIFNLLIGLVNTYVAASMWPDYFGENAPYRS